MLRKVTVSLLLATSLSACATYSWYHPTKSQSEFDQDKYACMRESAQAFPVVIQQTTTSSETSCSTFAGQVNCRTTPMTYSEDVNYLNRITALEDCMKIRGWTLRKDP